MKLNEHKPESKRSNYSKGEMRRNIVSASEPHGDSPPCHQSMREAPHDTDNVKSGRQSNL